MKKFLILLLLAFNVSAADKKPLESVKLEAILAETQKNSVSTEDRGLSFVWWVPLEYWMVSFAADANTPDSYKKELLSELSQYSLLAVAQADISAIGAFSFYDKETVLSGLSVDFTDAKGKVHHVKTADKISGGMELVLAQITPILKAAMGNMGENLHFLVFDADVKKGLRLFDPYDKGELAIELTSSKSVKKQFFIKAPLDSLYVPRQCPNGEDAHISWNYCPWSGKKL